MQDFLSFIAGIFEVDPSEISGETASKDYEKWDSLMMMRLVAEFEERYDTEIPIDEIPHIKTLNDLYQYTQKSRNV